MLEGTFHMIIYGYPDKDDNTVYGHIKKTFYFLEILFKHPYQSTYAFWVQGQNNGMSQAFFLNISVKLVLAC